MNPSSPQNVKVDLVGLTVSTLTLRHTLTSTRCTIWWGANNLPFTMQSQNFKFFSGQEQLLSLEVRTLYSQVVSINLTDTLKDLGKLLYYIYILSLTFELLYH